MLELDKSFFEGEERDGFYIEPLMKSAWAAQLGVLSKIDAICKKHNIKYFADWGTLLGAIRHQGFIPWDDDLDICMLRPDIQRFFEVLETEPNDLICVNVYNSEGMCGHAAKVLNHSSFTTSRKVIKENYGFPFMCGVDIFTIDYVPRDEALRKEQLEVLQLIMKTVHLKQEMQEYAATSVQYKAGKKMLAGFLQELEQMCSITFSEENPSEQELMILYEEVCGLYSKEDADEVVEMHMAVQGGNYRVPKEYYQYALEVPFENTHIPVPIGYGSIVKKRYGKDYSMPINRRGGHDYPFYNTLIKTVANNEDERIPQVREYIENISVKYYHDFLHKSTETSIAYEEAYFADEVIDGITVTEERKRIWAAQVEILEEIKRICKENQFSLYAIDDTIRDAVEYHDYAPFSEDIHLALKRSDYTKFIKACQTQLNPWFDCQSVYSSEEHQDLRCYIISDGYLCEEKEYQKRFHGCPHIVGIDIAILDEVDPNQQMDAVRKQLIQGLLASSRVVGAQPPYSDIELSLAEEWTQATGVVINVEENLSREFRKVADTVGAAYHGDCEYYRLTADLQQEKDTIFQKIWYDGIVELPFGNTTIPVPKGYQFILEKMIQ